MAKHTKVEVEAAEAATEAVASAEGPSEGQEPEGAVAPDPVEAEVQAWGKASGMDEDGYYVSEPSIVYVPCDLFPGLELRVGFDVTVAYRVVQGGDRGPGKTRLERECRRMSLIVPEFEGWRFKDRRDGQPIPVPGPAKWETYQPICFKFGALYKLYAWIYGQGLREALNIYLGNS